MSNTQEGTAKKITAPFTPGQVEALNRYQKGGSFHPFTCANKDAIIHLEDTLVATVEGWICPYCDYKQNWAHAFMAYPLANELEAPTTTQEGLTAEQLQKEAEGKLRKLYDDCFHYEAGSNYPQWNEDEFFTKAAQLFTGAALSSTPANIGLSLKEMLQKEFDENQRLTSRIAELEGKGEDEREIAIKTWNIANTASKLGFITGTLKGVYDQVLSTFPHLKDGMERAIKYSEEIESADLTSIADKTKQ